MREEFSRIVSDSGGKAEEILVNLEVLGLIGTLPYCMLQPMFAGMYATRTLVSNQYVPAIPTLDLGTKPVRPNKNP